MAEAAEEEELCHRQGMAGGMDLKRAGNIGIEMVGTAVEMGMEWSLTMEPGGSGVGAPVERRGKRGTGRGLGVTVARDIGMAIDIGMIGMGGGMIGRGIEIGDDECVFVMELCLYMA